MPQERFHAVGSNTQRLDAVEKVTGQAKYTGDLALPGLLEAKVLRSVFPHALIESIDAHKAEALNGVVEYSRVTTSKTSTPTMDTACAIGH